MERLTRANISVDKDTDRYLKAKIGMKEFEWSTASDNVIDLILNGPVLMGFRNDVLRKIIRELYVRLKPYEDLGLEPWQADAAKNIVEMAFEDKPERAERIRDLMRADKEGRVVVLPCKLGVDMVNRILPEQPFPMENVRLSITYYSRGRMYNMSLRTFEGAVKTGKIVVAGTDTEKAMEDKKNG